MKLKENKYLVAGIIGLVSITGAYLYIQVNKILDYTLTYKGLRNVNFDKTGKVSFTIVYEYKNKANIDVTLDNQEYEVYINNQYLTTLTNFVPNVLKGSTPSTIEVNLNLTKDDFKKVKLNWLQVVLQPEKVEIKTLMKWKVKYGFLRFPVKYPYIVNLKEIISWYVPGINKL
jgi:hypothetical protein